MKVLVLILTMILLLTGCGADAVFETVSDEMVLATTAHPREVRFDLAQEPVMPAMETDAGQLYLCGDFDVMLQTMESGDLNSTVYQVSGFAPEELTLIQTGTGEVEKYEFVWSAATDEGQQIGRCTILDDGYFHYALSATVDAGLIEEYQEIWNGIFESFELA